MEAKNILKDYNTEVNWIVAGDRLRLMYLVLLLRRNAQIRWYCLFAGDEGNDPVYSKGS